MFEMKNPFVYGTPVIGENFVGRDKEIADIMRALRNGKSVVLFSVRRMGKSSLLLEMIRRHGKDALFVYVDLYGVTSKNEMLGMIASAVAKATYTKGQKVTQAIRDLLRGVSARFLITKEGDLAVEFGSRELELLETRQIFDLAEAVGKKRKKRVIVLFDEFQEISSLDGVALLKLMRSRFQMHTNATYLFSGSKRHLLLSIFEETEGAFYHFAKPIGLGPIPKSVLKRFLADKFNSQGGHIDAKSIERILNVSRGSPYVVQHIAFELFSVSRRPKYPRDVDAAIQSAVRAGSPAYAMIWDSIKSSLQRRYLLAVAAEPGVIHGTSFIEGYGLRSTSHVQKIAKNLDSKGITEGGEIVNPLFALWLKSLSQSNEF